MAGQSAPEVQEQVLYSFQYNGQDGFGPSAGLANDHAGNFYGTMFVGGTGTCNAGCGTVFELSPNGSGGFQETVLYSLQNDGQDGTCPLAGLLLHSSGNLYGTTGGGGTANTGTVFKITTQNRPKR